MAKKKDKPEGQPARKVEITGNVDGANIFIGDDNTISQGGVTSVKPKATRTKVKTQPGSLPVGSNIPFPRNALFTGREADLKQIADSLLGDKPSATLISQAITGMGGIGKTQLAVEFAYQYGHQFDGVHWLNLVEPASLDAEIAACGRAMGLTFDDQREQVANTMRTWQSGGMRLLILDNFEEVKEANPVLAHLQGANMRMLITSRRNDWSKELGLHQLPLHLFSEKESLEFLERSLEKKEGKEERKALADKLGYLPLALELAAKYININRSSIADYLGELTETLSHESMRADWFKELEIHTPTEHELSLLATFQLSWGRVKDETAQNIFQVASYCAPNTPIPLEIFTATLELDEKKINKALYRLDALGLLSADGLPSIHPLLAAFGRIQDKDNELLSKVAQTIFDLSATANQSGLPKQMLPYQPHIRTIGEFAEPAKLEITGSLWNEFGYSLGEIADYAGAKANYERSLKIFEKQLGETHPNVATLVNNLGTVLENLGDLPGAKANYERALKIDEASFGPDHPNVAIRLNNLGSVLRALGDLPGARENFERALKIDEASFGPDQPKVAIRLNNLGGVLQDLGDLPGARENFERALKIDEASFGPDHPSVAQNLWWLGVIAQKEEKKEIAKEYYQSALKIYIKFLPEGHPTIKDVDGYLKELE